MATLKQIQTKAENFWALYGPEIISRQNAYLAAHGIYWQGLQSHGTLPDDGVETAPDLTNKPTDQLERWLDFFQGYSIPATWPIAVRIDVYDGPLGKGWTVCLRFTKNGATWERVWNFGPETSREKAWVEITSAAAPQGVAMRMDAEEEVADALVGAARPWYVRLILWIWGLLNKVRGWYVDLRGR